MQGLTVNSFAEHVRKCATVHDFMSIQLYLDRRAKQIKKNIKEDPGLRTMRQEWKWLTGAWRREYGPIASDLVEAGTNVSYHAD